MTTIFYSFVKKNSSSQIPRRSDSLTSKNVTINLDTSIKESVKVTIPEIFVIFESRGTLYWPANHRATGLRSVVGRSACNVDQQRKNSIKSTKVVPNDGQWFILFKLSISFVADVVFPFVTRLPDWHRETIGYWFCPNPVLINVSLPHLYTSLGLIWFGFRLSGIKTN